jgi:hypothetical protein
MGNPKNPRASWKRPFSLKEFDPVHRLALHVTKPEKQELMLKLFQRKGTPFESALADIYANDTGNDLTDLTDEELAYCEGWALLAELQHGQDPAALRKAIQDQITELAKDPGPDGAALSG